MGTTPVRLGTKPLLTGMNPEDENPLVSYKRNEAWSKPGPYVTQLSPQQEKQFQSWVKTNHIDWKNSPDADYDMRGFWKANVASGKSKGGTKNAWDGKIHYPDTWKTPYDATFSRQSKYAKPDAPYWVGDKLYTSKGELIVDETPKTVKKKGLMLKSSGTSFRKTAKAKRPRNKVARKP